MNLRYTVSELAAALKLSPRTVRWHCANPRGLMYGQAVAETMPNGMTVWMIPQDVAERFARDYEPYARKGNQQ